MDYGLKKGAAAAQVLHGRTQNGVKNHWHATMRKVWPLVSVCPCIC